jgi:hypothetical protein
MTKQDWQTLADKYPVALLRIWALDLPQNVQVEIFREPKLVRECVRWVNTFGLEGLDGLEWYVRERLNY